MELEELKNVWKEYDEKLEKNLKLNQEVLKKINLDKAESSLNKLFIMRILEAIVFFIFVVLLWQFIVDNLALSAPLISALVLNIFAMIGLAGGVGQAVLIKQIDYAGSVVSIQKQIEKVRAHNLQILKLMLLSFPFYLAYVFLGFRILTGVDLFIHLKQHVLIVYLITSVLMFVPVIWLYKQLGLKNPRYKWINALIKELGGRQIVSAVKFLNEIEEFENEQNG